MFNCKFCQREGSSASGNGVHERFCQLNPHRKERKTYEPWNKGKSKLTDARVAKHAQHLKDEHASGRLKTIISDSGKRKLSELAKARGFGGYRPHPNRGSRYKGIWFDSSWEVSLAKSLDEHSIDWVRPKVGFVWSDKGNKYYPDFFLPEYNVYLDPKNSYLRTKDANKVSMAQKLNNIKVLVLDEFHLTWDTVKTLL